MDIAPQSLEGAPAASRSVDAVDGLSIALGCLAATAVLAIMGISAFDIVARYLFNAPTSWAIEVCGYLLVAATFLGAAYAEKKGAHINVDILVNNLKAKPRASLMGFAAWLGVTFSAFAAWQSGLFAYADYRNGTRFWGLLETPQWIPQVPIVIGLVALTAAILKGRRIAAGALRRERVLAVPAMFVVLGLALFLMGSNPPLIAGTRQTWASAMIIAVVVLSAWAWSGPRMALAVVAGIGVTIVAFTAVAGQSAWSLIVLLVIAVPALLITGISIAYGLGLLGLAGLAFLLPSAQIATLAEKAFSSTNAFALTAVPMFVFMGVLLIQCGASGALFEAMRVWFGRLPGGLAHASIGACAAFAAVCGSSVATAATIGKMAAPEMLKRRYSHRLAFGTIAAGGTLGILIPPSIPLIIYGTSVGASVSALFAAGIIPGAALTLAFMATVIAWTLVRPQAAPAGEPNTIRRKIVASAEALPFLGLIILVLGSIYTGVATPSEAGAVGATLALLLCLVQRRLDWEGLTNALLETVATTSFILIIVVGTTAFTYVVDYLRLPAQIVETMNSFGFSGWLVLVFVTLLYLVLGMFIDPISMILITLPITYPIVKAAGYDPIWFGIYLVIMIEIACLTPPVGLNLFVLRGLSGDVPLSEIAIGAAPFVVTLLLFTWLLAVFPTMATWLPQAMGLIK